MNLIFNPRFNDLDCWDNTKVLIVFKEEFSAREKTFSPESDNTKYTASSLLTAYDKVKRTLMFHVCFVQNIIKLRVARWLVTHVETRKKYY